MKPPKLGSLDTFCETPDETLLSDLLLRLEELSVDCADASVHELLECDRELAQRVRAHSHVIPELERRFQALRTVDRIIRQSDAAVPTTWPNIPGYEIVGELGRGGMAIVYKARELALDRFVAIKLLLAGRTASRRLLERFQVEAEAIAQLQHPNIVQIHGSGVVDETPYLVLEFISGTNFKERIAARPMAVREVAELVEIIAEATEYAHQHDVIHRDLKPSNVLLTNDGVPKIVDFGLAKRSDDSALTLSGETLGTASYMAPEQAKNGPVGPASDVYSLGAILYEGLTGRPPFLGNSSAETLIQVCHDDLIPPSRLRPKLPRDLEAICQKCLEKNPKRRYASAKMLAMDINRWLAGRVTAARPTGAIHRLWKWTRRRPAPAALLILGLLMGVGVVAAWSSHTVRLTAAFGFSALRERAESSKKPSNDREQRLRDQFYATKMRLAFDASSAGQTNHMLAFLSQYDAGTEDANLRGFEWYYLNKLCHGDLLTFQSHNDIVYGVAFSPDDQKLATGSEDGTVKLWKAGTDQLVATLRGHTSCVNKLKFSPTGGYLATASCDRTVKLWDTSNFQEIKTFGEHDGPISDVAFSPDGTKLVACVSELDGDSRDSTATVWNIESGACYNILRGHELGIFSVAFSPDGSTIVTGGRDDTIRVWDAFSGKQRNALRGHTADVLTLAFSPDGAVLASGGREGQIIVWDWRTGELRREWRSYPLHSVMFSPDGTTLASAHDNSQIRLWDWTSGEIWQELNGHVNVVECLTFSSNGRLLATVCRDGLVKLWNVTNGNGAIKFVPSLDAGDMVTVAFGPDLETMASSRTNGMIQVWDLETGNLRGLLERTDMDPETFLSFSHNGLTLATIGKSTSIEVFSLSDLRPIALRRHGGKSESLVAPPAITYSANDRQLLTSTKDRSQVTVWHAHELRELDTFQLAPETPKITTVATSPNGRLAGTVTVDGYVKLFDMRSGKTLTTLRTAPNCRVIEFSNDELLFATASDESVTVWDARTFEEKVRLMCHGGDFVCLAFSPDGRRLATGSNLGKLQLWHVASGKELLNIDRSGGVISHVRFSRDGAKLAYWHYNGPYAPPSEVHVLSIDRER